MLLSPSPKSPSLNLLAVSGYPFYFCEHLPLPLVSSFLYYF